MGTQACGGVGVWARRRVGVLACGRVGGRVGAGVGVGEVAKKRELGNIINVRFEPGSAAAEIKNWKQK